MKTRNMVLYFSIAVLLISVAFSVSYAYMYATVTGNDQISDTFVRSANLEVNFANANYINSSSGKILLIDDNDRANRALKSTFTVNVSSNSTLNSKYDIYLTDITISNNMKNGDLKWELVKNGSVLTTVSDFSSVEANEDFKLNSSSQKIIKGNTDTYELRIWLSKNNSDQTSLLTGSQFRAKIKVKASPVRG